MSKPLATVADEFNCGEIARWLDKNHVNGIGDSIRAVLAELARVREEKDEILEIAYEHIKDSYNAACFDLDGPVGWMAKNYVAAARESSDRTLKLLWPHWKNYQQCLLDEAAITKEEH